MERGAAYSTNIGLGDPKCILNLLKSIITVSVETITIVNALPALKEKK